VGDMQHDRALADSPNRRERRVQETRRCILQVARELFESNGFVETTVEQIAERADVAPRTFFRYFPTKESLLFAELDDVRRRMLDALEQRPADEDPLRSLSIVLGELIEDIERRREDLSWGFRMCEANQVDGVYERSMIKEQTHSRMAAFLAGRLGVDVDTDPRPLAWTMAAMGVFSSAMRVGAISETREGDGPTAGVERSVADAVARFDDLLLDTAAALTACAEVRRPRD
jgi:TetR/AcrR family transcriptional regulator, regulator of mycofactocin system